MSMYGRVVRWEPTLGEGLGAKDPSSRWVERLQSAGVFLELDDRPRWEPARRVRRALATLRDAEAEVVESRHLLPEWSGDVPRWIPPALAVTLAAFTSLFANFFLGGSAFLMVAGPAAFGGLGWAALRWRDRGRREVAAVAARAAAGEAVVAAVAELTREDFVERTGATLVVCSPRRLRVERAMRAAMLAGDTAEAKRCGEALRAIEAEFAEAELRWRSGG